MSDDLVNQSLAELQDIVRCRCHPAYTGRGLHDPDCECDSADAVKVVADRIKELEAKLVGAVAECERIGRLWHDAEANLAKAVEALEWQESQQEAPPFMAAKARATLAGLKGDTND